MESTENYSSATTLTSAIQHEATLMPIVETQLPNSINSPLISDKPYFLIDSSAADEIHFMSLGTEQSMLGSRFVATTYMIDAVSDSNALTLPAIFLSLSIESDVSSSTYEGKSGSALLLESSDSSYRDILELPSILNEMSTHVFNIFSSSFSTESVSKPEKSVVVSATVTESPPLSISPNIQTTETTTITSTAQRTTLLPYTGTSIDVTTRFPHYSPSSSRVTDTATFPSLFTQFSTLLTGTTPPLQTTLPIGGTTVPLGTTPWPVVPNTTVPQQFSNARSMLQHSALLALQTTASHLSKELETVSSTPGPGLSATVRGEVNTVSNSFLANIFSDENFNGFLPAESTFSEKTEDVSKISLGQSPWFLSTHLFTTLHNSQENHLKTTDTVTVSPEQSNTALAISSESELTPSMTPTFSFPLSQSFIFFDTALERFLSMQLTDPVPSPEVAQITKVNLEISLSEASLDTSEDLSTQAQKISSWMFASAASLPIPRPFDTFLTGHVTFFPTISEALFETATLTASELSTTSSNEIIASMPSATQRTSPKQSTLALSENKDSTFQSEESISLAGLNDLSTSETPSISVEEQSRFSMKQSTLELLSLDDSSFPKSFFPNDIQSISSQGVEIFTIRSAFENSSPSLNSDSPRQELSSHQAMESSDNTPISPSTTSDDNVLRSENTAQLETKTRAISTQLQSPSLAQYLATTVPDFEPSWYVPQHSILIDSEWENDETSFWEDLAMRFPSMDSVSSATTLNLTAEITPEVLGTLTSELFPTMADIINSATVDNWATFVSSSFTEEGFTFLYITS